MGVPMSDFRKSAVSVTLTGEQWFALIAALKGKSLSFTGAKVFAEAIHAMAAQVGAASDAYVRKPSPAARGLDE
jgi:hypothetical protein